MKKPVKIFACKLKNQDLRMESQSGGAFSAIALYFLKKGGIIYGCGMDSEKKAVFKRIDNADELIDLKGSKYVQADMGDIFTLIKEDLGLGKLVLFSGTPCYVNAVNLFFRNNNNRNNLYTVDIICHGVPSPMVYKDYLNLCAEKENSKVVKFAFREKISGGWHKHMEKMIFDNGKEIITDDYTQLFYTNLTLRPSCGKCPFSSMKRCSDFTVGDYWGVQKFYPEFDDNTGVSLLFINDARVLELLNEFKNDLDMIEITEDEACQQKNLKEPTDIPKVRNWFWRDYKKHGIEYCLRHWSPKAGFRFKLKRKMLRMINMWE